MNESELFVGEYVRVMVECKFRMDINMLALASTMVLVSVFCQIESSGRCFLFRMFQQFVFVSESSPSLSSSARIFYTSGNS